MSFMTCSSKVYALPLVIMTLTEESDFLLRPLPVLKLCLIGDPEMNNFRLFPPLLPHWGFEPRASGMLCKSSTTEGHFSPILGLSL